MLRRELCGNMGHETRRLEIRDAFDPSEAGIRRWICQAAFSKMIAWLSVSGEFDSQLEADKIGKDLDLERSRCKMTRYLNSGPQIGYFGTRTRICAVLPLHLTPWEHC
jgi:hypothetical protein